jgi:hypothetical protein
MCIKMVLMALFIAVPASFGEVNHAPSGSVGHDPMGEDYSAQDSEEESDDENQEESLEVCAGKLAAARKLLVRMQRNVAQTNEFVAQIAKQINKIEKLQKRYARLLENQITHANQNRYAKEEILTATYSGQWSVIDSLCNLVFGHKIGDRKKKDDVEFVVLADLDRFAYSGITEKSSSGTLTKFGIPTDDEK